MRVRVRVHVRVCFIGFGVCVCVCSPILPMNGPRRSSAIVCMRGGGGVLARRR